MKAESMRKAARLAAIGYIFTYIQIQIAGIDFLPDFVGYFMLLRSAERIAEEEKESALLKPLGFLLVILSFFSWVIAIGGSNMGETVPIVQLITMIVSLYFHFQLLTDFAKVAGKYENDDSRLDKTIVLTRNIQTVVSTAAYVSIVIRGEMSALEALASILVVLNCFVVIACLLALSRSIRKKAVKQPT